MIPRIARKRVSEIMTGDVLAVIVPIWHTKTETARRVKGLISSMMRWAIAQNYTEEQPCKRRGGGGTHLVDDPAEASSSLTAPADGCSMQKVRESSESPAVKLVSALITLTACQSWCGRANWAGE